MSDDKADPSRHSEPNVFRTILGCLGVPTADSYALDGRPVDELTGDE